MPSTTPTPRVCPPEQVHQPLYPYTVVCAAPDGIYAVPAGAMLIFTLDIVAGESQSLTTLHLAAMDPPPAGIISAQDWTLRVWASATLLGNPQRETGLLIPLWRPRPEPRTLLLRDSGMAAPDDGTTEWIGLPPGQYWLHVHNLANTVNAVQLTLA